MEWNPEKIKSLRLRLGWCPSEMARRLSCHTQEISLWEAGIEMPAEIKTQVLDQLLGQAEMAALDIEHFSLADQQMDRRNLEFIDVQDIDVQNIDIQNRDVRNLANSKRN